MDPITIIAVVVVAIVLGYPAYCVVFAARKEPMMNRMSDHVRR